MRVRVRASVVRGCIRVRMQSRNAMGIVCVPECRVNMRVYVYLGCICVGACMNAYVHLCVCVHMRLCVQTCTCARVRAFVFFFAKFIIISCILFMTFYLICLQHKNIQWRNIKNIFFFICSPAVA